MYFADGMVRVCTTEGIVLPASAVPLKCDLVQVAAPLQDTVGMPEGKPEHLVLDQMVDTVVLARVV